MENQKYIDFCNAFPPRHSKPGFENPARAAVFIPLLSMDGEWRVLFQKRARAIRQGGEISFPGGRYDPVLDQTTAQTAMRETCEELGLVLDHIQLDGMFDTISFPEGGLVDIHYGFLKIDSLDILQPEQSEVEHVFTLPFSFFWQTNPEHHRVRIDISATENAEGREEILLPAQELGLPERYHRSWGGVYRDVFVYPTAHGPLWGMTAWIIHTFVRRYREITAQP